MLNFITYEELYIKIAKELLATSIGTRIPTYDEYQEKYQVSRGNLQRVFTDLKEKEIITLKPQGFKGTILIDKNIPDLLRSAHINFLMGYTPIPFSTKFLKLSTYISDKLNESLKIPVNLTSLNTYRDPISSIEDNTNNFSLISVYAAEKLIEEGHLIEIAYTFSPNSFARPVVYFKNNRKEISNGSRVAVDPKHPGHYRMIREYAEENNLNLVSIEYADFPSALMEGKVDLVVLEETDMNAILSNYTPFTLDHLDYNNDILPSLSTACIVTSSERPEYKQIISEAMEDTINDETIN